MSRAPKPPISEELVRQIWKATSEIADECGGIYGGICVDATDAAERILDSAGIAYGEYASNPDELWGGAAIDSTHHYVVLLPSGWIIDPTIRQFIDSPHASDDQRKAAEGYPHFTSAPNVAVIPPNHPYIDQMGYESHTTGRGWTEYHPWLRVSQKQWEKEQRDIVRPWLRAQGLVENEPRGKREALKKLEDDMADAIYGAAIARAAGRSTTGHEDRVSRLREKMRREGLTPIEIEAMVADMRDDAKTLERSLRR